MKYHISSVTFLKESLIPLKEQIPKGHSLTETLKRNLTVNTLVETRQCVPSPWAMDNSDQIVNHGLQLVL